MCIRDSLDPVAQTWVLTRHARRSWGLESANRKLREYKPSRLYEVNMVCAWCSQLLNPEDRDDVE